MARLRPWLGVIAVVLALGGWFGWQRWKSAHPAVRHYPTEVRTNFIVACLAGAPIDVCRCSLNHIEHQMPYVAFALADSMARTSSSPPAYLVEAMVACLGQP